MRNLPSIRVMVCFYDEFMCFLHAVAWIETWGSIHWLLLLLVWAFFFLSLSPSFIHILSVAMPKRWLTTATNELPKQNTYTLFSNPPSHRLLFIIFFFAWIRSHLILCTIYTTWLYVLLGYIYQNVWFAGAIINPSQNYIGFTDFFTFIRKSQSNVATRINCRTKYYVFGRFFPIQYK